MFCGRCCVTGARSRPAGRLDIFIEIPRWSFHEKAHPVKANVVASDNSVNRIPYALRFHPHSFRAYQGGSVLVGIRPERRCYLRCGLSHRALTIPHLAVAGTKRKIPSF